MNPGYYDPWPATPLRRPLALIGFVAPEVAAVGTVLAGLAGWSFVDTDRRLEHDVGRSRHAFTQCFGLEELRREEARVVQRALDEQPASVLALGDGALLSKETAARVREQADLVYLEESFAQSLERLRRRHADPRLAVVTPDPEVHHEQLAALFQAREPGYQRAARRFAFPLAAPGAVAHDLFRELGLGE